MDDLRIAIQHELETHQACIPAPSNSAERVSEVIGFHRGLHWVLGLLASPLHAGAEPTELLASLNVALWGFEGHTYHGGVVDRVLAWLREHTACVKCGRYPATICQGNYDIIEQAMVVAMKELDRANGEIDRLRAEGPHELLARVQNYLGNGGLFNPELMDHDKVRGLVMDLAATFGGSPWPTKERLQDAIEVFIARWGARATLLRGEALIDRAGASVGLAEPKEQEAAALERCATELSAIVAPGAPQPEHPDEDEPLHAGAEPEERDGNVVTSVRVNRRPSDGAFRFFTGGTIELLRLSRADALRVASDIIELAGAALSSSRTAPEGPKP